MQVRISNVWAILLLVVGLALLVGKTSVVGIFRARPVTMGLLPCNIFLSTLPFKTHRYYITSHALLLNAARVQICFVYAFIASFNLCATPCRYELSKPQEHAEVTGNGASKRRPTNGRIECQVSPHRSSHKSCSKPYYNQLDDDFPQQRALIFWVCQRPDR